MDGKIFSDVFKDDLSEYSQIFDGNREFIQEHLDEDPNYFINLAKGQTPQYLIISCSDSRVPPNDLTKLKPGDIFNHRNIANQVINAGMNVNSVIQYAVEHLKVKHIIVMGHTFCGGIKAAIDGTSLGGMLDLWISHVKNVYDKYQDELDGIEDMQAKVDRLSELNVMEQVINLWKNPYIQKSWKKGNPVWVHGWIFRVETGRLEEIVVETQMPSFLKVYQFKFDDLITRESVVRKSVLISPLKGTEVLVPEKKKEKPKVEKSSIWSFDDYQDVQRALMQIEAQDQ